MDRMSIAEIYSDAKCRDSICFRSDWLKNTFLRCQWCICRKNSMTYLWLPATMMLYWRSNAIVWSLMKYCRHRHLWKRSKEDAHNIDKSVMQPEWIFGKYEYYHQYLTQMSTVSGDNVPHVWLARAIRSCDSQCSRGKCVSLVSPHTRIFTISTPGICTLFILMIQIILEHILYFFQRNVKLVSLPVSKLKNGSPLGPISHQTEGETHRYALYGSYICIVYM